MNQKQIDLGIPDDSVSAKNALAGVGEAALARNSPSPDLPDRSAKPRGAIRPLPAGARNESAQLRAFLAACDRSAARGERKDIPAFRLFDPFKRFGDPRLSEDEIAALADPGRNDGLSFRHRLPPGEPVAAAALCRRINSLRHALEDLDALALRLARWRARRHRDTARPKRWSPMRPGRPPGWKRKPKTDVEEVLKECHFLDRDAWDTS